MSYPKFFNVKDSYGNKIKILCNRFNGFNISIFNKQGSMIGHMSDDIAREIAGFITKSLSERSEEEKKDEQ